jgi:predicted RNase H-like HicB family nuclease
MKNKKITFKVERTEEGFLAQNEELGIFTDGNTVIELIKNVYEATDLHFEKTRNQKKNCKRISDT